MKFYNRDNELEILSKLDNRLEHGIMTVLTGRRRVGKTLLALQFASDKKFLYLFIGRKEEHLLCQEFTEEIAKNLKMPIIGEIKYFKDIFRLLLEIGKSEKFILIIDEFQEFFNINPSVYSDIQKVWDLYKQETKVHVIFIGSVYSLMHKIFEESKQPLFGRADRNIRITAFTLATQKLILKDLNIFTPKNYFNNFVITGGMPKYIDIFVNEKVTNFEEMLEVIFQKDSTFLNEGKNILIEEFGKEYLTYFAILELLSIGKTSRGEIESLLEKDVGGYIQKLEQTYGVIAKHNPINAKPRSRNQKYKIIDNFLNFWFRFIYRHRSAIEIENFSYLKSIIKRDYASYCGPMLERFFQKLLAETQKFNRIGSYWEKDNRNEIDIVAINDLEKKIFIIETKLNKSKINLNHLAQKAQNLLLDYKNYTPTYLGLSIDDADKLESLI